MLSNIGGVAKALIYFFGIVLYPISEYGYHRNISKKLYLAATKQKDLFKKKDNWSRAKCLMDKWTQKERIPTFYDS